MIDVELEIEERVIDGVIKSKKVCRIPESIECFKRDKACEIIKCYGALYNEKTQCYECPMGDFKKPAIDYVEEKII